MDEDQRSRSQVLDEFYLVLVKRTHKPFTTSDTVRERVEDIFLGREIGDQDNQTKIQSWIDVCWNKHEGPCARQAPFVHMRNMRCEFEKLAQEPFFGVIDVHRMMLTSLAEADMYRPPFYHRNKSRGLPAPFVALSYVWDSENYYQTTMENVSRLQTPGGLDQIFDELPVTIRDAFGLVRRLGYRYLWVDALCIVQDTPGSRAWKLNARHMHLIYGSADLTICAADGNASTELRAIRAGGPDSQEKATCAPGVELMISRAPEVDIRQSRWNRRAWTFQERLLSRRCLIFVNGRVYFQCWSSGMSEAIIGDPAGGWSLDLVDASLQMLREVVDRPIWLYMKCVPLYTQRQLSRAEDILAAFEGIRSVLKVCLGAEFVYGMPVSHFDLALLWRHEQGGIVKRRQRLKGDLVCPSWSWSGWMSSDALHPCPASYSRLLLSQEVPNVEEWLRERTWIQWYIRSHEGALVPLHHGLVYTESQPARSGWGGYRFLAASVEPDDPKQDHRVYGPNNDGSTDDEQDALDFYGRDIPIDLRRIPNPEKTLTEFPFNVVIANPDNATNDFQEPQPVLQFYTYYERLYLAARRSGFFHDSEASHARLTKAIFDIADDKGDWCGMVELDPVRGQRLKSTKVSFIAISDARDFSLEECPEWTYYIPKDRSESFWDVYYVLLIDWIPSRNLWERLGLGKVFKAAFAKSEFREIVLG